MCRHLYWFPIRFEVSQVVVVASKSIRPSSALGRRKKRVSIANHLGFHGHSWVVSELDGSTRRSMVALHELLGVHLLPWALLHAKIVQRRRPKLILDWRAASILRARNGGMGRGHGLGCPQRRAKSKGRSPRDDSLTPCQGALRRNLYFSCRETHCDSVSGDQ